MAKTIDVIEIYWIPMGDINNPITKWRCKFCGEIVEGKNACWFDNCPKCNETMVITKKKEVDDQSNVVFDLFIADK